MPYLKRNLPKQFTIPTYNFTKLNVCNVVGVWNVYWMNTKSIFAISHSIIIRPIQVRRQITLWRVWFNFGNFYRHVFVATALPVVRFAPFIRDDVLFLLFCKNFFEEKYLGTFYFLFVSAVNIIWASKEIQDQIVAKRTEREIFQQIQFPVFQETRSFPCIA